MGGGCSKPITCESSVSSYSIRADCRENLAHVMSASNSAPSVPPCVIGISFYKPISSRFEPSEVLRMYGY